MIRTSTIQRASGGVTTRISRRWIKGAFEFNTECECYRATHQNRVQQPGIITVKYQQSCCHQQGLWLWLGGIWANNRGEDISLQDKRKAGEAEEEMATVTETCVCPECRSFFGCCCCCGKGKHHHIAYSGSVLSAGDHRWINAYLSLINFWSEVDVNVTDL